MKPALGILALLCYISFAECRSYRFDYAYNEEINGWVKLHRMPVTWNEARLRCHAEGAVLASPLNEPLLEVMKNMITVNSTTHCGVYTGIHASFHKGVYESLEGIPLSKIPVSWAPDEPDNYEDSENCLVLLPNGAMADLKCNEVLPYICYKKKTKEVVQTACGTTDNKYHLEPRTGSCYKLHLVCQTWHDAYMTCAAEGGHLAIVNSPVEASVLKELYAKIPRNDVLCKYKESILLGFLVWSENHSWFTIHGETLEEAGYAAWGKNQPDGAKYGTTTQKCGALFSNGLLDDVWCDTVTFPFFCEKSPDSLLAD
ncbi:secretory phospholipase A2 receptor-like [Aphomia sociella]